MNERRGEDDLAAFCRARLDEDEQVARAAKPGPWSWRERQFGTKTFHSLVSGTAAEVVVPSAVSDVYPSRADAEHIARHDPARVLAEVAANRLIIAEYNKASDVFEAAVARQTSATPPPGSLSSDEVERNVAVLAGWKQAMQHSLEVDQAWTVLAAWRRAVQLLALPHAGHSDYQQMWALA